MEKVEVVYRAIEDVIPYANNPRINDAAVDKVAQSIKAFGFKVPIILDRDHVIVAGHTRLKASKQLGLHEVPVIYADDLSPDQTNAFRVADNRTSEFAEWDLEALQEELDHIQLDMGEFDFDELFDRISYKEQFDEKYEPNGTLADRFIVPPFSILDTKQGEWKDRKKQWLELGIKSEVGRGENLVFTNSDLETMLGEDKNGTSVFDPVLCEVVYKWFAPEAANILDVFAGGSVRGVVAEKTGHRYTGIDLRPEQIAANIANAKEIGCNIERIKWVAGNSLEVQALTDERYDLFFTCPPYHDLEIYSDHADDLSNMDYENFVAMYTEIIANGMALLKDDRFAVVVISDIRDKKGFYRDLVGVTKKAMSAVGAELYNDIILLNNIGTAPIRANKSMRSRKVVRLHQNVLVFYKGEISQIKQDFEEIEYVADDE